MRPTALALFALCAPGCAGGDGGDDDLPLVAADPVSCGDAELFGSSLSLGNTSATFELVAFVDDDGARELQFADGSFVRYAMDDDEPSLAVGPGFIDLRAGTNNCFGEGCDFGVHELANVADGRFLIFGKLNSLDDAGDSRGAPSGSPVSMDATDGTCPAGGAAPAALIVATDDGDVRLSPTQSTRVTIEGAPWLATAGTARYAEFVQDEEDCADCASPGLHSETSIDVLLYRVP